MKLNSIFSDNMVLQAEKPIYIFGTGKGTATVQIADKTAEVISNDENWLIKLPAFDYGGPYKMTVNLNGIVKEINDIYFGDVYLLSGQSNNQLKLWQTNTPKEYYKDNDAIRLFTVDRLEDQGKHILTDEGWKSINKNGDEVNFEGEHYESKDGWIKARKDEVGFWSAIGYLVADELAKNADKKIGLIACYQGASCIQSWLPEHFLDNTDYFVPLEIRGENARNPLYSAWNNDGALYNGMLKPILSFSMKAVIWYQGESNSNGADSKKEIYAGILKMLIDKWRKDFNDEKLPFVVIQIHDYIYGLNKVNGGWRDVQAAQEMVCEATENAYLVKSADICETDDIHPVSKIPLALRIVDVLKRI